MDKATKEKALAALDRQRKQYARQNQFIKDNYERQTVTFPKGTKQALKDKGVNNINGFINGLVRNFIEDKE